MAEDSKADERFPAPVYTETVLRTNFNDAKKYFLHDLIQIHYAQTMMLCKQGIIALQDAKLCIQALDALDLPAISAAEYDGSYEDLFFLIEKKLAATVGIDAAGKMHTARSRNDIDITLYRMALRREVLDIMAALSALRAVLLHLSDANIAAIMPGYTHTQPAQPTTLAHYLAGVDEMFARDQKRLIAAFETVDHSPMGACAITTTGFPIDRRYMADLLGFDEIQLNSWGAIASVDYVTETAAAIAVCMVNVGKLIVDLLQWCTPDFGYLRLSDAFVQISSIMPQKRNPVALEHVRILASKAFAQAQGVLMCQHNTPFGDIVDSEDDLQPLVFAGTTDCLRALRLLAGALAGAQFDRERMLLRSRQNFITTTELADTLVRKERLSFRVAHRVVSSAIRICQERNCVSLAEIVFEIAPAIIGRSLTMTMEDMKLAANPEHFIAVRDVPGGPGSNAIQSALISARAGYRRSIAWSAGKSAHLDGSSENLKQAVESVRTAETAQDTNA